jgi:serine/threonine protein kinase
VTVLRRVSDNYSFRWKIAAEITRQLVFLHERGVFLMHIRPTNVLFSSKKGSIQFTNLGWAVVRPAEDIIGPPESWPTDGSVYAAPELATPGGGLANPEAVDVWSLGVILYEVLSDAPPPQRLLEVLTANPTALVNSTDPEVRAAQRFCVRILLDRPPAAEILAHPFLAGFAQVGLGDFLYVREEAERPERPVFDPPLTATELWARPEFRDLYEQFTGIWNYFRRSMELNLVQPERNVDERPADPDPEPWDIPRE